MTAWLIRRFVKDYENTENGEVRAAYGTLGSCVGILVNLLLSAGKFLIGLLSGSVAILRTRPTTCPTRRAALWRWSPPAWPESPWMRSIPSATAGWCIWARWAWDC